MVYENRDNYQRQKQPNNYGQQRFEPGRQQQPRNPPSHQQGDDRQMRYGTGNRQAVRGNQPFDQEFGNRQPRLDTGQRQSSSILPLLSGDNRERLYSGEPSPARNLPPSHHGDTRERFDSGFQPARNIPPNQTRFDYQHQNAPTKLPPQVMDQGEAPMDLDNDEVRSNIEVNQPNVRDARARNADWDQRKEDEVLCLICNLKFPGHKQLMVHNNGFLHKKRVAEARAAAMTQEKQEEQANLQNVISERDDRLQRNRSSDTNNPGHRLSDDKNQGPHHARNFSSQNRDEDRQFTNLGLGQDSWGQGAQGRESWGQGRDDQGRNQDSERSGRDISRQYQSNENQGRDAYRNRDIHAQEANLSILPGGNPTQIFDYNSRDQNIAGNSSKRNDSIPRLLPDDFDRRKNFEPVAPSRRYNEEGKYDTDSRQETSDQQRTGLLGHGPNQRQNLEQSQRSEFVNQNYGFGQVQIQDQNLDRNWRPDQNEKLDQNRRPGQNDKSDRNWRPDQNDKSNRNWRPDQNEKSDRNRRADQNEKSDRNWRPDQNEKSDRNRRVDQNDKSDRNWRPDQNEKSDQNRRADQNDKSDRNWRPDQNEKLDQNRRPDQNDKSDRNWRPDQNEKSDRNWRPDQNRRSEQIQDKRSDHGDHGLGNEARHSQSHDRSQGEREAKDLRLTSLDEPYNCKLCKITHKSLDKFERHLTSMRHSLNIMELSLKMDVQAFKDKFTDISWPFTDVPPSGRVPESVTLALNNGVFEPLWMLRSGLMHDFYCKVCGINTREANSWLSHCDTPAHKKVCDDLISTIGINDYMAQFWVIPGPHWNVMKRAGDNSLYKLEPPEYLLTKQDKMKLPPPVRKAANPPGTQRTTVIDLTHEDSAVRDNRNKWNQPKSFLRDFFCELCDTQYEDIQTYTFHLQAHIRMEANKLKASSNIPGPNFQQFQEKHPMPQLSTAQTWHAGSAPSGENVQAGQDELQKLMKKLSPEEQNILLKHLPRSQEPQFSSAPALASFPSTQGHTQSDIYDPFVDTPSLNSHGGFVSNRGDPAVRPLLDLVPKPVPPPAVSYGRMESPKRLLSDPKGFPVTSKGSFESSRFPSSDKPNRSVSSFTEAAVMQGHQVISPGGQSLPTSRDVGHFAARSLNVAKTPLHYAGGGGDKQPPSLLGEYQSPSFSTSQDKSNDNISRKRRSRWNSESETAKQPCLQPQGQPFQGQGLLNQPDQMACNIEPNVNEVNIAIEQAMSVIRANLPPDIAEPVMEVHRATGIADINVLIQMVKSIQLIDDQVLESIKFLDESRIQTMAENYNLTVNQLFAVFSTIQKCRARSINENPNTSVSGPQMSHGGDRSAFGNQNQDMINIGDQGQNRMNSGYHGRDGMNLGDQGQNMMKSGGQGHGGMNLGGHGQNRMNFGGQSHERMNSGGQGHGGDSFRGHGRGGNSFRGQGRGGNSFRGQGRGGNSFRGQGRGGMSQRSQGGGYDKQGRN